MSLLNPDSNVVVNSTNPRINQTLLFPKYSPTSDSSNKQEKNEITFNSITKMTEYEHKSFEEWRWLYLLAAQGQLNQDQLSAFLLKWVPTTTKRVTETVDFNNPSPPSSNVFSIVNSSSNDDVGLSNVEHSQINMGIISINGGRFHQKRDMDFSDLLIDIYDNNKVCIGTIKTFRFLIGEGSRVLSNMLVQNPASVQKRRDDKFVLELSTSMIEPQLGNISGSVLHLAIRSYLEKVDVHIDDFLQVFSVWDYFQFSSSMNRLASNELKQALKLSQPIARSFVKNFNTQKKFNFSQPENNTLLFDLFRIALNTIIDGNDFENQTIITALTRNLFEYGLQNAGNNCYDSTKLLRAIDYWVSNLSHLPSLEGERSYEIACLLDRITRIDPVLMIQLLSCSPSTFQFMNSLSAQWKLKLINKYVLMAMSVSSR